MVDPPAVAHAQRAGPGGRFDFAVGGKRDHVFSQPLAVRGQVLACGQPARYILRGGHLGDALEIDMGTSAIVRLGDVTLLLVERPGPGSTPLMYRCVGLEPKDFKIVIVKSPAGFRAEFEPFAAGIILSACPGCASPLLERLPYRRLSRPIWPLDPIDDDWRTIAWCHSGTWRLHRRGALS
jgi:microcystin degradation protein MlrC